MASASPSINPTVDLLTPSVDERKRGNEWIDHLGTDVHEKTDPPSYPYVAGDVPNHRRQFHLKEDRGASL